MGLDDGQDLIEGGERRADGLHRLDPGRPGALDDRLALLGERREVQMTMTVDQHLAATRQSGGRRRRLGQRRARPQRVGRVPVVRERARLGGDGELVEDARRSLRQEGLGQQGEATDGLGQSVEHRPHPRRVGLAQGPGRLSIDVAIGRAHHVEDRLERPAQRLPGHRRAHLIEQLLRRRHKRAVVLGRIAGLGHPAVAVTLDQREHALHEIAVVVGEVPVHAGDHRAAREVAVVAERHLAQEEIARLVEPVVLDQLQGIDHVAERFRDLLSLVGPPAMGEHAPGRRQAGGEQKGRPVDRMKAQDVFADDVHVGRPERAVVRGVGVGVAERGHVVGQRIQPDVDHVLRVVRHRDSPAKAGARHRQILQSALDEADHLVAPRGWQYEVRVRLVVTQQRLLPGREAEEIARLLEPFDRRAGRRQTVDQLAFRIERFVAHRVPAGVAAEIDLIAAHQLAPERLNPRSCAALRWSG